MVSRNYNRICDVTLPGHRHKSWDHNRLEGNWMCLFLQQVSKEAGWGCCWKVSSPRGAVLNIHANAKCTLKDEARRLYCLKQTFLFFYIKEGINESGIHLFDTTIPIVPNYRIQHSGHGLNGQIKYQTDAAKLLRSGKSVCRHFWCHFFR